MFKQGDTVELIDNFTGTPGDVRRGDLAKVHMVLNPTTRMYVRFLREDINQRDFSMRHGASWGFEQFRLVFRPPPSAWKVGNHQFTNINDAIQHA